jgi:bifunctional non-homologous end joining protein LigD
VEVSNPDRVVFPEIGRTKRDVVEYYEKIAHRMVPHLHGRPLALQRFPDGISRQGFLQKQAPDYLPDWINTIGLERVRGGRVEHIVCDDGATLVYLANQAAIALHRLLVDRRAPPLPSS